MANANKTPFSKDFLKQVEGILLAEKERLENDLKKFAHEDPNAPGGYSSDFPNYGNDESENASEVADYEVRVSLENNLEKSLRDITQSLARLKSGDYGVCKYCKNAIEEKRLLVRPHSSACMSCKKAIKQEV